ncbi:hypothetical protein BBG47_25520 [Paenibacillus sp. KS1]|uniref:hypothetical protein n=1 Tax=Paenibacillus sp. KS1 TaxID=1849249 RepID=UPI0008065005|nr:hypothetical protein [Paenibacillus sp. KS1]OBY76716.1 hypothetical protein BBG47_25520 [Paenibacillus sp. KS1]
MTKKISGSHQALMDEYDELLLKMALSNFAAVDGEQLEAENRVLKEDPFFQPSKSVSRDFEKRIKRGIFLCRIFSFFNIVSVLKAALGLSICLISILLSIVSVKAVRVLFLNLLVTRPQPSHSTSDSFLLSKDGGINLPEVDGLVDAVQFIVVSF